MLMLNDPDNVLFSCEKTTLWQIPNKKKIFTHKYDKNLFFFSKRVKQKSNFRSLKDMPKSVEDRMRELTAQFGLDYDSLCVNDNTNCAW